jgi:hypothetical protein
MCEGYNSQPVPPFFPEPKENTKRKSSERPDTICRFISKYVGDRFGNAVAAQCDQANGHKFEFPRHVALPTMRTHGDADTRSNDEKHRHSERQKWKWVSVGKKNLANKNDKETYCPCVSIGFAWNSAFHVGEVGELVKSSAWPNRVPVSTCSKTNSQPHADGESRESERRRDLLQGCRARRNQSVRGI